MSATSGLGRDNATWCHPAGALATEGWDCVVDDSTPGWAHTGLRTATLTPGGSVELQLGDHEAMVLPLDGGVIVDVASPDGETESFTLHGRTGVFAGATDVVYAPPGTTLRVRPRADLSEGDAVRVAVCLAHAGGGIGIPARYLPAAEVPVELRGAGIASRQVRNFGVPGVLDAHRIIACEVVTPAGNWSSWPPHKHDTDRPGVEAELEEIYWFETQSTDGRGTDAVGYQRVYGTADRPIDVLAEVRTGDVVLVPHGWHGPAGRGPRRRPVLPQRDGRPGRRARLADLRRPRARLGARDLARPPGRPPAHHHPDHHRPPTHPSPKDSTCASASPAPAGSAPSTPRP